MTETCIYCGKPIWKDAGTWRHESPGSSPICNHIPMPHRSTAKALINPPALRFVAVRTAVMQGSQWIATACSKTMAKRISNALNRHTPNREGV